jgi:hypothetical protein
MLQFVYNLDLFGVHFNGFFYKNKWRIFYVQTFDIFSSTFIEKIHFELFITKSNLLKSIFGICCTVYR